jgi:hypothetical protein
MKASINQQLDEAVSVVPVAVRFWRRVDATLAQGQEFLRTFRQLLEIINFRKTTLRFVATGLHYRIDAFLYHGGLVVRTVRQLFGDLSARKTTLIFVAAGLLGLALILLLLEISVRGELAREASDAAIDASLPKPVVRAPAQALQSPATALPQSLPFPLPTVYGVYAISGGQLRELEALPGRVPDQRVFMSTPIRTLSRTVLPDGQIVFIVYRRDVASSAPERVTVRVIAKIMRSMTFATAGPVTARVEDSWTIRNLSHELRVAPVHEGSEMLMIRPENPNFVFPAGRYGLVIKGQAYDFTVAGPVTEPAQCLEGVKAANGTFYSECRRPSERQL